MLRHAWVTSALIVVRCRPRDAPRLRHRDEGERSEFGGIDVLVNNVGTRGSPAIDLTAIR